MRAAALWIAVAVMLVAVAAAQESGVPVIRRERCPPLTDRQTRAAAQFDVSKFTGQWFQVLDYDLSQSAFKCQNFNNQLGFADGDTSSPSSLKQTLTYKDTSDGDSLQTVNIEYQLTGLPGVFVRDTLYPPYGWVPLPSSIVDVTVDPITGEYLQVIEYVCYTVGSKRQSQLRVLSRDQNPSTQSLELARETASSVLGPFWYEMSPTNRSGCDAIQTQAVRRTLNHQTVIQAKKASLNAEPKKMQKHNPFAARAALKPASATNRLLSKKKQ